MVKNVKISGYGLKKWLGLVVAALLIVPVVTSCSADMTSYGPNLVGAKTFQDESIDVEERLFIDKKKQAVDNLPAPAVTGSVAQSIRTEDQKALTQFILDDLAKTGR